MIVHTNYNFLAISIYKSCFWKIRYLVLYTYTRTFELDSCSYGNPQICVYVPGQFAMCKTQSEDFEFRFIKVMSRNRPTSTRTRIFRWVQLGHYLFSLGLTKAMSYLMFLNSNNNNSVIRESRNSSSSKLKPNFYMEVLTSCIQNTNYSGSQRHHTRSRYMLLVVVHY